MDTCNHGRNVKVLCVYEGCDSDDLLMCPDCMYVSHSHPLTSCVRLDYLKNQMAPVLGLLYRKSTLEEQLRQQIALKKKQAVEFLDNQEVDIKQKLNNMFSHNQKETIEALENERVPGHLRQAVQTLISRKGGEIQKMNNTLSLLQVMIGQIQNIDIVNRHQQESLKRPSSQVEYPAVYKKANIEIWQNQERESRLGVSPVHQEDGDCYIDENGKCPDNPNEINCESFQEGIRQVMRHRNSRELTIKLNIIKKEQKYCTSFLDTLQALRNLETLVLIIDKSFLFYQFNMGSLLKSLQKMTFLREISLEFATKDSSCEDFLLAMLEKRMSRHNIHLNIIKV